MTSRCVKEWVLGQVDMGELRVEDGVKMEDHMKSLWQKKYMWYLGVLSTQICRNVLIVCGCNANELGCGTPEEVKRWNPLTNTTKDAQAKARIFLMFVIA